MRYDDFKAAWKSSLSRCGLPTAGWPTETLDLATMTRRYRMALEPHGGQDAEPFHVSATVEFRWDALHAARTHTTEEDMLTTLFGRDDTDGLETEAPWLRVDVKLRASLPWGRDAPMPSKSSLQEWARETSARLERIEPLLPEDISRESSDGAFEILGWKGDPEIHGMCGAEGGVQLSEVTLSGWQAITLPRNWDDPDREDDHPGEQLDAMFARLKAAMFAWMDCLDHIRPKT